ncbi:MAG: FAD-binding oxidoreductase [Gordonia sp. (in: high G+C Gram-positive bacteria)]
MSQPLRPAWYNNAFEDEPDLFVEAASTHDIAAAISYARKTGSSVAVRGTGHGIPGSSRGGVLVSTAHLRGVNIDSKRKIASVQSGATWGDVIEAAAPFGLIPLSGSSPTVGVAGYLLEGGIGLLARRYGYTAARLVGAEVVTASGLTVTADLDHNSDLLWALRGGGGNFGVVWSLEVELVDHPEVFGGGFYYRKPHLRDAAHQWLDLTLEVSEDTTTSFAVVPFPDRPSVPHEVRGDYGGHARIAHVEASDTASREPINTFRRATHPVLDTTGDLAWINSGSIYSDPLVPMGYVASNILVGGLGHSDIDRILDLVGPGSLEGEMVTQINHLGGALQPRPEALAAGRYGSEYLLRLLTRLRPLAGNTQAADVVATHRRVFDAIGLNEIGVSLNFSLGVDLDSRQVENAYESEAYARLRAIKTDVDPGNIFRAYHNIEPFG